MDPKPEQRSLPLFILWGAITAGLLIFSAFAFLLRDMDPLLNPGKIQHLREILLASGGILFLFVTSARRVLLRLDEPSQTTNSLPRMIVLWGISESIGFLGFLSFLLFGDFLVFMILLGLSFLALWTCRPRRDDRP